MTTTDLSAARELPLSQGARTVPDRTTFETLARRDDVPGQLAAEECKLLILGVDTPTPQLYFLNTNEFAFHYDFATRALGLRMPLGQFNAITYFRDDRSNLAGTIIANDRFAPAGGGEEGLYALEFWPTRCATTTSGASARRPPTSPSCARCCRPASCPTATRSRSPSTTASCPPAASTRRSTSAARH